MHDPHPPEQAMTTTTETPHAPEPVPAPEGDSPDAANANRDAASDPTTKAPTGAPAPVTSHKPTASSNAKDEEKIPPKALDPLELRLSAFGALEVNTDQGWVEAAVHRCFPWMEPGKFISLRVDEGGELALVKDLAKLTPASQTALRASLQPASFAFNVQKIVAIKKDLELRIWVVQTDQGLRTFQTELDEWPRDVAGGALLIQDVSGDLYRINDHTALDKSSQKMLWAFLN